MYGPILDSKTIEKKFKYYHGIINDLKLVFINKTKRLMAQNNSN